MGDLLFDDLVTRLARAGRDERRVIERVLGRLEVGRKRYGELDLAKPRDWRRERFEERLDALVYDVAEELVLEDAARTQAADAEWRGEPTVASEVPARIARTLTEPARRTLGVVAGAVGASYAEVPAYESIEIDLDDIEGKGE